MSIAVLDVAVARLWTERKLKDSFGELYDAEVEGKMAPPYTTMDVSGGSGVVGRTNQADGLDRKRRILNSQVMMRVYARGKDQAGALGESLMRDMEQWIIPLDESVAGVLNFRYFEDFSVHIADDNWSWVVIYDCLWWTFGS